MQIEQIQDDNEDIIIESMLAEIILSELSNFDTSRNLTPTRNNMRTQMRQTDLARIKQNELQLKQDAQSQDPLVRRKAQLQKMLAQVIKQLRAREAQKSQQQQQQSVDSIAGGLNGN